jgi:tetratricopeptide (TPR) repeat protein
MRRALLTSFLILLLFPALTFAQRDSARNVWLDAESWLLFEEYGEALPLYQSLLKSDPGNDNLNYKIGICLLNDPYQKDKAIQYLLDASHNINPSYKENSLKERTAPPDVLYYLGSAYLVNELLEPAIESYEEFLEVMDHAVYDEELVQTQIKSCRNAQRLLTMPVDIDLTLIDSLINTRYPDIHPVVSGDGTKMAFVTELPFYDGAFFTEKTTDGWSYPQMITQMLGFDADVYPVALSYDGSEMILYYDDDYIGNLYYSRMEDGLWTSALKMGEHISTKYWESHASFSKDGQTLYFTSNRKGGHGGLDIYLSEKQADGKWGPPQNLGTTINSRYNEECPYISEDGQVLYFSSYGHYNMGGYDIFYSRKTPQGKWAEPVNIGYPINTTDDNLYFQPIDNGNAAYYSVFSPSGIGRHDIYYMNIYSVNNPRLYYLTGNLGTEDGHMDSSQVFVYVIDTESGDTLLYTNPTEEGAFAFQLKQGIYELHFSGEGYDELIRPLQITTSSNKRGIALEDNMVLSLHKEEIEVTEEAVVYEGKESQIKLKETQFEAEAGKALVVPVIAPKGSTLVVRTYQDSVLISTDTLVTEKRKTDLQLEAIAGASVVELELTDKEGNIHRNSLIVVGSVVGEDLELEGIEEQDTSQDQARDDDPVGIMLLEMQDASEGGLLEVLLILDPEKEKIDSEKELFEYLYEQADNEAPDFEGVHSEDIDLLLVETLAGKDAPLLLQQLIEQANDPLKTYLEQLDLEAEGIHSSEDLLKHMEKVAEDEGFTMEEVREAMLESLGHALQVCSIYEELLQSSEGAVKEVLESLDLREDGIYTVEQLINLISRELEALGLSKRDKEQILNELFGEEDGGSVSPEGKRAWPLLVLLVLGGTGLIWFIIAWWRRREKKQKQED